MGTKTYAIHWVGPAVVAMGLGLAGPPIIVALSALGIPVTVGLGVVAVLAVAGAWLR
jgi:hypothetical protein